MTHSSSLQLLKQEFCDFIDLLDREADNIPGLIPYSTIEQIMKLTESLSLERTTIIKKINSHHQEVIKSDQDIMKRKIQSLKETSHLKEALLSCVSEEIFTDRQIDIFIKLLSLRKSSTTKEEREYRDMENMLDYLNGIREYNKSFQKD